MNPVLFATDFADESRAALGWAASEATRRESSLVMMHCVEVGHGRDNWSYFVQRSGYGADQFRTEAFGRLTELYEQHTPDELKPTHVEYVAELGRPADRILGAADDQEASLIVLAGTTTHALERLILGSVSEEVVRSASRPVMVVPPEVDSGPIETILAPVDFSACSRASLREAAEWAERHGATLVVLHAFRRRARVPPFEMTDDVAPPDEQRRRARERLDEMVDELDSDALDVEIDFQEGDPAEIVRHRGEEHQADLVVMGTHGRRGLERFFVGSTAMKVLRAARRPVVTVRHFADA